MDNRLQYETRAKTEVRTKMMGLATAVRERLRPFEQKPRGVAGPTEGQLHIELVAGAEKASGAVKAALPICSEDNTQPEWVALARMQPIHKARREEALETWSNYTAASKEMDKSFYGVLKAYDNVVTKSTDDFEHGYRGRQAISGSLGACCPQFYVAYRKAFLDAGGSTGPSKIPPPFEAGDAPMCFPELPDAKEVPAEFEKKCEYQPEITTRARP